MKKLTFLLVSSILSMSIFGQISTINRENTTVVRITTQFFPSGSFEDPDEDSKSAIRISTNGVFQVWTKGSVSSDGKWVIEKPHWLDIVADGFTPELGKNYEVEMTLNFKDQVSTVTIIDEGKEYRHHNVIVNNCIASYNFPFAKEGENLKSISFSEDSQFSNCMITKFP